MTTKKIKPLPIPEWLKSVANDANISSREICRLFGVGMSGLWAAVDEGRFPQPEVKWKSRYVENNYLKHYWKARTVRNFLRGY